MKTARLYTSTVLFMIFAKSGDYKFLHATVP